MALFIALEIVLTRIVGLMPSSITRISLSFIVYAFAGTLFGPLFTALTAGIGDVVGAILFPPPGGFFPGFTLSAIVSGLIMGFVILDDKNYKKVTGLLLLNTLVVDFVLNTTWLKLLQNIPFFYLLIQRLPGILINNVLRFTILFALMKKLQKGTFNEDRHSNRAKRETKENL